MTIAQVKRNCIAKRIVKSLSLIEPISITEVLANSLCDYPQVWPFMRRGSDPRGYHLLRDLFERMFIRLIERSQPSGQNFVCRIVTQFIQPLCVVLQRHD